MRPRVAVLVSSPPNSALDVRAHSLFDRLGDRFETTIVCHQGNPAQRINHFLTALRRAHPALVYLMDPIYAAVAATQLYSPSHRIPVVLDTGDRVFDLACEMGRIVRVGLTIVKWSEQTALKIAKVIVVRSGTYRDWLSKRYAKKIQVIPDGVDLTQFFPTDATAYRAGLGFSRDETVLGILGTMGWNVRHGYCYGWDLIEALALVRDLPVRGLVIGDGDGVARLKARAQELQISERLVFMGRLLYAELPSPINAMDICLLTQPDSPLAQIRTTGKLPLYLACDKHVVASDVGEPARLLKDCGTLVAYEGPARDDGYPSRLADQVRLLVQDRKRLRSNGCGVQIARENFDYNVLAPRLSDVIESTLG